MRIAYRVTLDDLVAFNRHHSRHSPSFHATRWTTLFAVSFLVLGASFLLPAPPGGRWLLVGLSAAFVLALPLFFDRFFLGVIDSQARKLYAEGTNAGMLGEHELEIGPEGIVERTAIGETRCVWRGVERIVETDDFALIYVSAVSAHVVPKRAIVSGELGPFVAAAREYWEAARSTPNV